MACKQEQKMLNADLHVTFFFFLEYMVKLFKRAEEAVAVIIMSTYWFLHGMSNGQRRSYKFWSMFWVHK